MSFLIARCARVATAARPRAIVSAAAPVAAVAPVRMIGTAAPPTPGPDNYMVGRQLQEFEMQLAGVAGFADSPAKGPFGTIKNPVKIYSSFHSRIVGCKGSDNVQHRLSWFELKEGPKHVCTECGQVWQLITPNTIQESADKKSSSH